MSVKKVSITVDDAILEEARGYANGNLSAWFNDAAQQRLKFEHMRDYLAEAERELGPIPEEARKRVDQLWPF